MEDLSKKREGQGGQAGGSQPGAGGSALASVLSGAIGGGIGGSMDGGVGGLLGGGLGAMLPALLPSLLGMLGGASKPGQSGMHQLLDGMHAQGMGGVADSWVGTGDNQPIAPAQVEQALGADKVQQLSAESGLPPEQVSQGVAAILPGLVNHLTPDGQVPSAEQVQKAVAGLASEQASP
jgi:uncharacterized protein YidB (DUF937 family)